MQWTFSFYWFARSEFWGTLKGSNSAKMPEILYVIFAAKLSKGDVSFNGELCFYTDSKLQ